MIKSIYKSAFLGTKFLFHSLRFLFLLIFAVGLYVRHIQYDQCVTLPNGIILAYESYFNFTARYLMPTVVVRGPDGTLFSHGRGDSFHFSATTAYWSGYNSTNKVLYDWFIYRPDVGLVHDFENPDLYIKLMGEKGELLEEDKGRLGTDVWVVLVTLKKNPKYASRDCHVSWVSFKEYKKYGVRIDNHKIGYIK